MVLISGYFCLNSPKVYASLAAVLGSFVMDTQWWVSRVFGRNISASAGLIAAALLSALMKVERIALTLAFLSMAEMSGRCMLHRASVRVVTAPLLAA